ncbi:MAG TPA: Rieske (2Fe-2S) protein [Planctomycetota bacterium]|nr:Rieske (2Fe-2S) protein [Planctomycetota bacterium]
MERDEQPGTSRRDFLGAACALSACATCALSAVPVARYLAPLPEARLSGPVDVGPDDIPEGGFKAIEKGAIPLLIIRAGGKLTAVNATCTHLACLVKWDEKSGLIRCPCHSATFRPDGTGPTTPAARELQAFPVRSEKGRLVVVF